MRLKKLSAKLYTWKPKRIKWKKYQISIKENSTKGCVENAKKKYHSYKWTIQRKTSVTAITTKTCLKPALDKGKRHFLFLDRFSDMMEEISQFSHSELYMKKT